MNYYEHHLGDYLRDTAHLSMLEDGAYRRLLDAYYIREVPLPLALRDVFRLVRAQSKQDRDAVETVLREFFDETPDGWRHGRCDREIAAYADTIPEREARRENDRERQRRTRERRKQLFDELRKLEIVPAYDTKTTELEAMLSRVTSHGQSRYVTPPVTRDNTATHTPDTRHQTPDTSQNTRSGTAETVARVAREADDPPERPDPPPPTPAGAMCRLLRQHGIADVNPGNAKLLALLQAGATEAEFLGLTPEAQRKAKPFAWLVEALTRQREEAAMRVVGMHRGPLPATAGANRQARQLATAGALVRGGMEPLPATTTRPPEVIDVEPRAIAS